MNNIGSLVGEYLSMLLTMENITFVLATIGAVGTAIEVLKSRRNLSLKLHHFNFNKDKHLALAYIQIDNYSRLPISITDVHLVIDDVPYPCKKLPARVYFSDRKVGATIVSSQDFYNLPIPVHLSGLGGTSGFFLFEIPPEYEELPAKLQTFQVSANRGRAMKVILPPDREYFLK